MVVATDRASLNEWLCDRDGIGDLRSALWTTGCSGIDLAATCTESDEIIVHAADLAPSRCRSASASASSGPRSVCSRWRDFSRAGSRRARSPLCALRRHRRASLGPAQSWKTSSTWAHFPFVHTDILGSEPHTEALPWQCRRDPPRCRRGLGHQLPVLPAPRQRSPPWMAR